MNLPTTETPIPTVEANSSSSGSHSLKRYRQRVENLEDICVSIRRPRLDSAGSELYADSTVDRRLIPDIHPDHRIAKTIIHRTILRPTDRTRSSAGAVNNLSRERFLKRWNKTLVLSRAVHYLQRVSPGDKTHQVRKYKRGHLSLHLKHQNFIPR